MRAFSVYVTSKRTTVRYGIRFNTKEEPIKWIGIVKYYSFQPIDEGLLFCEVICPEKLYHMDENNNIISCNLCRRATPYSRTPRPSFAMCKPREATVKRGVLLKISTQRHIADIIRANQNFCVIGVSGDLNKEIISLYYGKLSDLPHILMVA